MNRKGDWIQTFSGKKFYPLDPRPEDICFEDIAHALALICRYNGHSREFYSVAEHSVRMSLSDLPGSPQWRLMHDAAEAYLCDIPKPVKRDLPGYKMAEDALLKVIGERFNLGLYDHDAIGIADMVMLATEKRDVLTPGSPWELKLPAPLGIIIFPWPWEVAEKLFLNTARELGVIS